MIAVTQILEQYGIKDNIDFKLYGNGLINHTYLIEEKATDKKYILQQVNKNVFKNPLDIDFNIQAIATYITRYSPSYKMSLPIEAKNGRHMIKLNDEYFRLFLFIEYSHTIDTVTNAEQAYEASKQFGTFTSVLNKIKISELKNTIPNFHNLELRFEQYNDSLRSGNTNRIQKARTLIDHLKRYTFIVNEFQKIKRIPEFKIRVMHHDTKISNVLFNEKDKGICVIDLDTVMPGYFISDVGDMMRTYLSPVSENENDLSKINIRKEFYEAILSGYTQAMGNELTGLEKKYFIYSGKFMIYMQALRFLTDHFNDDIYYGAKIEDQNYLRALNQLTLLDRLSEFEKSLI